MTIILVDDNDFVFQSNVTCKGEEHKLSVPTGIAGVATSGAPRTPLNAQEPLTVSFISDIFHVWVATTT